MAFNPWEQVNQGINNFRGTLASIGQMRQQDAQQAIENRRAEEAAALPKLQLATLLKNIEQKNQANEALAGGRLSGMSANPEERALFAEQQKLQAEKIDIEEALAAAGRTKEADRLKVGGLYIDQTLLADPSGKTTKQFMLDHPEIYDPRTAENFVVGQAGVATVNTPNGALIREGGKWTLQKPAPESKGFDTIDLGDRIKIVPRDGGPVKYEMKRPTPAGSSREVAQERAESNRTFRNEQSLNKSFMALPEVKDFAVIEKNAKLSLKALAEQDKGQNIAVDQSIITIFNKMLDPESAVKEGEYARTQQDQSLLGRIKGKWSKIQQGGAGLSTEEREAMGRMIANFTDVATALYNAQVDHYVDLADYYGYNPKNIIRLGGKKYSKEDFSPAQPKTVTGSTKPQQPKGQASAAVVKPKQKATGTLTKVGNGFVYNP